MTTVAHFSDVHALSLRGVSPLAFLNKRLAGGANLLLKRRNKYSVELFRSLVADLNRVGPDQVVVTGDLTNLSLDPEFELVRAELRKMNLGPADVSIIPGNHDVYVWAARLRKSFERYLGPYAASDGGSSDAPTFPLVRVRGDLAIIGLSTAIPTPVPFAAGRLGRAQLDGLERALEANRDRFRLLLIHHPPLRNRHAFLRGLIDRRSLQSVLARAGAELVVHGHEHRDLRAEIPGPSGPIPVVGVGSATHNDPRPDRRARYNLIHIEGRAFTIETRVHDPGTDRFQ